MKLKYICMIILVLFLIGFSPNNSSAIALNNTSNAIDITNVILTNTSPHCADYVNNYKSSVEDVDMEKWFDGKFSVSVSGDDDHEKCIFHSNAIPNHNFDDGNTPFPNNVSQQTVHYEVSTKLEQENQNIELSLDRDNGVFLNGVKLDLLAAACYDVGDEKIGCNDMNQPWRYDPMSSLNDFDIDSHNAHAQSDGTYHYHGSPVALFDSENPIVSPVIGFAADGFPIFGSYFKKEDGTVRKAKSSYRLRKGPRQAIKAPDGQYINPGGYYDGTYRDDYEYVAGLGDLDECNGMNINGVYSYFVTDTYPWVIGCFKGTPDPSFNKPKPTVQAGAKNSSERRKEQG